MTKASLYQKYFEHQLAWNVLQQHKYFLIAVETINEASLLFFRLCSIKLILHLPVPGMNQDLIPYNRKVQSWH
jgi:hypothetical protein